MAGLARAVGEIHGIIAEGRSGVFSMPPARWDEVALVRFKLMKALSDFNHFKEEAILVPIAVMGDPALGTEAKAIGERNRTMQRAYDDFVAEWPLRGPASMCERYKAKASEITSLIEHCVDDDALRLEDMVRRAGLAD